MISKKDMCVGISVHPSILSLSPVSFPFPWNVLHGEVKHYKTRPNPCFCNGSKFNYALILGPYLSFLSSKWRSMSICYKLTEYNMYTIMYELLCNYINQK